MGHKRLKRKEQSIHCTIILVLKLERKQDFGKKHTESIKNRLCYR